MEQGDSVNGPGYTTKLLALSAFSAVAVLTFAPSMLHPSPLIVWVSTRQPEYYPSAVRAAFDKDFPGVRLVERLKSPAAFLGDLEAAPRREALPITRSWNLS